MQTNSPYSAGPRLSDTPRGDPAAQAIASLRGYAYQLYASALAWLDLKQGQQLYLEVAKDYAVVAGNALNAVEVKDTGASRVTINSLDIRDTLHAFVGLTERNPQRRVYLRFLSTSSIGIERKNDHRVNSGASLLYWRRAAAGADLAPLRKVLSTINLTETVQRFIEARSDEELRDQLLKRIHWDCGNATLDGLTEELSSSLVRYGASLRIPPSEASRLSANVLHHILRIIVSSPRRRLIDTDLYALLENSTRVSVPRSAIDDFLRMAQQPRFGGDAEAAVLVPAENLLEHEADMPLPDLIATRTTIVADLVGKLRMDGFVFVTGGTGRGKTLLARLAARSQGGEWRILDLRDASIAQCTQRLDLARRALGAAGIGGLILDDLNEIEEPMVQGGLRRLLQALRRRDVLCLATAYRKPSARAAAELGLGDTAGHLTAPDLSLEEISALVASAGGDPASWARPIYLSSDTGHPQLVQAIIRGLRVRGWPNDELQQMLGFQRPAEAEAEQLATRRHLVSTVSANARDLLYRLSILIGRFDRTLGINVAAIAPPIRNAGEQLDLLIGPWIEQVGRAQLRISPLLAKAGRENLTGDEQTAVYRLAAETMMAGHSINVIDADTVFVHGLLGKSETVLLKAAYGVLKANEHMRGELAEWFTSLRLCRTDTPIYAENPTISRLLRFAQLLLVSQHREKASIRACWNALHRELNQEPAKKVREAFEYLVLARVLIDRASAGLIDNWVGYLLRFQELSFKTKGRQQIFHEMGRTISGRVGNTPIGMVFIVQAMGIPNVIELKSVFNNLDDLSSADRRTLFADLQAMPNDFSLFVNSAWLAQHQQGSIDGRGAADLYLSMADQARGWNCRELATRCYVARSVMLDEYADDPDAALRALDEAINELGADPVLSRARAKVLYRRKDHAQALELMRDIAADRSWGDPIERAYLLREAAISAAELGKWSEPRKWFAAGSEAARKPKSSELRVMAVGLQADGAVAAYKLGDAQDALRTLGAVLDELEEIDPQASRKAAYCHRVVRHTCLWLFGQATGRDVEVDGQPAGMVPGICSNPEPPDLADLPLGPLNVAWYLLTQAEIALGIDAGIERRFRERLKGNSAPMWEMTLSHTRLGYCLRYSDHLGFVRELPRWVDSQVYLEANGEALSNQDALNPLLGEIPRASHEQLATPHAVFAAEDGLLAFGMVAAWSLKREAISALCAYWRSSNLGYPGEAVIDQMDSGSTHGERLEDDIANQIYKLYTGQLIPDELFRAGLRFIQLVARSNFKQIVMPLFEKWIRENWSFALENQRFLFKSPSATAPPIEEALVSTESGLRFIARVLLAAEAAVNTRLHPNFRKILNDYKIS